MKYKPYESYKDSEIKWLGKIPAHWDIFPIQYALKPIADNNIGDNWSHTQLLSLTLKGIVQRDIDSGKGKSHSDYSTYQKINRGDFVFCLFDIEETPRTVGYSNLEGMITSAYTALKPTNTINPKYIYYLFESIDNQKGFGSEYSGMRKTIRPTKFLKLKINIPSLNEQNNISDFLDLETLKIQNLISKQEQLIKLLDEQRKSIISHAVTKGLNPSAPLKHIDHKWIAQIPEHWDMYRLRFISKIYAGGTPDRKCKEYWENGTIPWINSGAVNQVNIVTPSEYITEMGYRNSSANYIPKNSLVMALAGQGKTKGMVAYTSIETTCNQSMAAIVPKDYDYKFLFYWLSANYQNIRNMTGGDNREGLNLVILSSIPCPKLPINEQREIALYLDKETLKIDNLILKQNQLIEKLKEYRSSIISHAVTGKIDVREAL